ncbi:BMP family ABC transporter substrate-binding protein [Hominisplanchenecus murintestinalis]|jgi:basic membrane lipoprotein Med (substrate-binding protein (PBP1-ABC) superfamily)|uniref:BMP family ABC transporter substrate-binding protein n=1 Tax=Hominisplanchenecus murintestinalis TaxID=2941517 RepID=A0AC61R1H4_9FIRM|nr:BMP family ABC transporter substrate-binding protein [Hominisplanchenecus murintestinalis]NBH98619.1 BMP family ABC transporter substrate-binding protein [Lachnospiraceae bacterium]NBI75797.1 BMP family ABC transporter substrate-binding protein [Lachnospiraceae bacterium]RKJ88762.1 BMP family ABC transporter substrate-binding protein [Anaerotruncus sp. 1XD22-93]TGX99621.1 BMP family ABC transporter substrate-binding protein [Hominisplanchenecus murintestinalis]
MAAASEALVDYEKAYRMGKKEGGTPAVLDDILKERNITASGGIPLGLVQIPAEQIVGTKSAARSAAFSKGFYPLLKADTEFAAKWMALYQAHLDEGIREPVKAYEFMNRFYIEEGNKRVSVLKFVGAVSVLGTVTRIIPPHSEDKETRIYYEFMDFYHLSGVNYIWFSQPGSFAKLQYLLGKRPDEEWSDDDKLDFSSAYTRFSAEFEARGGKKLEVLPGDAFLSFIGLYGYEVIKNMTAAELKEKLAKSWDEFKLLRTEQSLELQMDPADEKDIKKNIFERLFPISVPKQKVAFIHEETAETSAWTYAHELGRLHLQQMFSDQVSTACYDNGSEENAEELLEAAVQNGSNLIFTTSPIFLKASLKAAIEHPEVKILNCSLNTSHRHIRTYYGRMYEPKFLMGAIAGALSENGKIGYIANYPIFGMAASINAFALGAKMVNPRAKIYLEWSTLKNHDVEQSFAQKGIRYISGRDMIAPDSANRQFGLYRMGENGPWSLAMPVWHWGKFYEKMIWNIMDGSWKYDDASNETKGLNYWWGMSAGIVDVICSQHLPIGTARLIELLKKTICSGEFNPFSGILYSQQGIVQKDAGKALSPEEIITMDWLAENVIGSIPQKDALVEKAKAVVSLQGLVEGSIR